MMLRCAHLLTGFCWCLMTGWAMAQAPFSTSVLGKFHTDANTAPTVEQLAAMGDFLFVTALYDNGDQKLEIWNVCDPRQPVQVGSVDYGNIEELAQNHYRFPYLNVFDDVLIVRSNYSDLMYRVAADGTLVSTGPVGGVDYMSPGFLRETGLDIQPSDAFGSMWGRVAEPYHVPPQAEYQYSLINYTNPRAPFMIRGLNSIDANVPFLPSAGAFTGVYNGQPALISFSGGTTLNMSHYTNDLNDHINTYWLPKFPQIFEMESMDISVRERINGIIAVRGDQLSSLLGQAIDDYWAGLGFDADDTVQDVIEQYHQGNQTLTNLLAEYDIHKDEPLRTALEKIAARRISAQMETQWRQAFFEPILNDWVDGLFKLPTEVTPAQMQASIAQVLNENINTATAGRFILDKLIGPMCDYPDWLAWSLDDAVDHTVDSSAGQAISLTVGAAHAVATGFGFLDAVLTLAGKTSGYLPDGFPEDCREVLNYILYEHGAELNPDGLAFIEIIKLCQYYMGNADYKDYEDVLTAQVLAMNEKMAGALTETIYPFYAQGQEFAGDVPGRIEQIAGEFPSWPSVARPLAQAMIERLEARGVDTSQTVARVLADYDLTDLDTDTVQELITALDQDIHEAQTQLSTIFDEAKDELDGLEAACRTALEQTIREAWGQIDLDISIMDALYHYMNYQIDLAGTFGQGMDELIGVLLRNASGSSVPFTSYLSQAQRVANGDCIARWQVTLELAAAACAITDPEFSATCLSLDTVLAEAYTQASDYCIRLLVGVLCEKIVEELSGHFESWTVQLEEHATQLDLANLTQLNPYATSGFVWENQIGAVVREEYDFLNPRRISLVMFDPKQPAATARELLLGNWGSVDYVHMAQGVVMVGGLKQVSGYLTRPTATFIAVDDKQMSAQTFQGDLALGLADAEMMITINRNANLALAGPKGVYLLPNPRVLQTEGTPQNPAAHWTMY